MNVLTFESQMLNTGRCAPCKVANRAENLVLQVPQFSNAGATANPQAGQPDSIRPIDLLSALRR